jgi:quinol monooxygenase YgiN
LKEEALTATKPITEPKQTITPHLVVRGGAAASQWYQRALGAKEQGRIPVPGGRFMQPGHRSDRTVGERRAMARLGMVGKLVAHPGRRGELLELLMAAIRELKGADGCELYVVGPERDDLYTIWVVEAWRDEAAHRASLDMPGVRAIIERGMPLIAELDGVKLEPVGGVGLDSAPAVDRDVPDSQESE